MHGQPSRAQGEASGGMLPVSLFVFLPPRTQGCGLKFQPIAVQDSNILLCFLT